MEPMAHPESDLCTPKNRKHCLGFLPWFLILAAIHDLPRWRAAGMTDRATGGTTSEASVGYVATLGDPAR